MHFLTKCGRRIKKLCAGSIPAKLIPLETPEAMSIYQNGGYLFGELFLQMGYRGPLDGDQRLWFVNFASK